MKNKIALTLISFLANFIMAGFASQFGMLIEPIAVRYSADVNTVASIFSLLNGGALAGTIAAFFLIEKIGVKRSITECQVGLDIVVELHQLDLVTLLVQLRHYALL